MGTSFTCFNGKGFWTNDVYLEAWLGALIQEIDHLTAVSQWLTLVRQEWHLQATVGFGGHVSLELDKWVTTDEEKRILIALSEQTHTTLAAYGNMLPCDVLNALIVDETISSCKDKFTVDVPLAPSLYVGRAFIQLLKEELSTTAEGKDFYVGANSLEELYRWD